MVVRDSHRVQRFCVPGGQQSTRVVEVHEEDLAGRVQSAVEEEVERVFIIVGFTTIHGTADTLGNGQLERYRTGEGEDTNVQEHLQSVHIHLLPLYYLHAGDNCGDF